jgi:Altronate dehydratase
VARNPWRQGGSRCGEGAQGDRREEDGGNHRLRRDGKGLWLMDTPGYDIMSVVGMVAGGATLVIFTTGRGTPTGNPIAPVIKVTANPQTARKMRENIDFDASTVILGQETIEQAGERLFKLVIDVARGKPTRAELLGFREFMIHKIIPSF